MGRGQTREKYGLVHTVGAIVRMRIDFPEYGEIVISRNILAILYRILVRLVKHFRVWSPLELIFDS